MCMNLNSHPGCIQGNGSSARPTGSPKGIFPRNAAMSRSIDLGELTTGAVEKTLPLPGTSPGRKAPRPLPSSQDGCPSAGHRVQDQTTRDQLDHGPDRPAGARGPAAASPPRSPGAASPPPRPAIPTLAAVPCHGGTRGPPPASSPRLARPGTPIRPPEPSFRVDFQGFAPPHPALKAPASGRPRRGRPGPPVLSPHTLEMRR
jgi:hypothetical protein